MLDKLISRFGYTKISESEHGVWYEKEEPEYGYTRVLCINHRNCGTLVQSYDKQTHKLSTGRFINECDSIEVKILTLIYMKYLQLKRKYRW